MKIEIIAPCFYPNIDAAHLKYFIKSAWRHGLQPLMYGLGRPYTEWINTHITECLEVLHAISASHFLFTDASDIIFTRGMDEIERRYMRLGRPAMLVPVEPTGMNGGGWLGEREVAIATLEHLASYTSSNPQERWREAVRNNQVKVAMDDGSVIFRVTYQGDTKIHDTCLVHFAGGYTDQVEGKAAQMEPMWKELGYDR